MERYTYSPLRAAREVRLLRLFAGADDDELSGEFFHSRSNCKDKSSPRHFNITKSPRLSKTTSNGLNTTLKMLGYALCHLQANRFGWDDICEVAETKV
ncbi:hypothetical protein MCOR03_002184 [Pyricularia oryzae]|nr:hypothetical protein MCOR03_002184 [Pyricularia oryzae]KAI6592016.1 hypothetical protein MCOR06_004379 [Pyricularia oryzae]